jgi:hypothetical protein
MSESCKTLPMPVDRAALELSVLVIKAWKVYDQFAVLTTPPVSDFFDAEEVAALRACAEAVERAGHVTEEFERQWRVRQGLSPKS